MTESNAGEHASESLDLNRRSFVKLASTLAAGSAAIASHDVAAEPPPKPDKKTVEGLSEPKPKPETPVRDSLPNSMAPAIQFQPFASGTGAFFDSLPQGPIERQRIAIRPWVGDRPGSETEIAFLPAHRLAALIQAKKLSPVELTDIYIKRLKQLDPKLLCVVTLLEESAREAAKQAEAEIKAGEYRGPLHGIPWGLKDLFAVKGAPTTWGTKPYENRVIDEDSEVYVRLREAGAILIAKLATGVLALGDNWFRGRCRNPWNVEEGSSGSSAGPGSATAAGCVGFSIGTETQGSIVSPSKRCGISALRPTFGRVSRHGGMTLAWSMDKVGPMCRTIEDCALVFNAIHGADSKDPSTVTAPFAFDGKPDLSKLSIGYLKGTDQEFLNTLTELGAKPKLLPEAPNPRGINQILEVEAAAAFDEFIAQDLDKQMVNAWRAKGFRTNRDVSAVDYLNNQRKRLKLMQEMDAYMDGVDAYVSMGGDIRLTNLTGNPSAVVPYKMDDQQPRCLTLIGRMYADDVILSIAHAYQSVTDWHDNHPDVS